MIVFVSLLKHTVEKLKFTIHHFEFHKGLKYNLSKCKKIIIQNFTMLPGPALSEKEPDSEPPISFDDMLTMTAAAEVDGVKFDGIDMAFLTLILTLIVQMMI